MNEPKTIATASGVVITLQEPQPPHQTWADIATNQAAIQWLWYKWFPVGFATLLVADPGLGKSLLVLTLVQRFIHGGKLPDGEALEPTNSTCLWVETEAGEAFHIQRARNIGLDIQRIITPLRINEEKTSITLTDQQDRQRIEEAFTKKDVMFMVIDSLSGGYNLDENSTAAGEVVKWLADLAKRTNKSILITHHTNKQGMRHKGAPSMADARGNTSILQYVRNVWSLHTREDNPEMLQLTCIKSNLAAKPLPVYVAINEEGLISFNGQPPLNSIEERVIELNAQGYAQRDICGMTGLSSERVKTVIERHRFEAEKEDDRLKNLFQL